MTGPDGDPGEWRMIRWRLGDGCGRGLALPVDRLVDGSGDAEQRGEAGDLQWAQDLAVRAHQPQLHLALLGRRAGLDESRQPAGAEELDAVEVAQQPALA